MTAKQVHSYENPRTPMMAIYPGQSTNKIYARGLRHKTQVECLELWYQIVENYSQSLLTVPSDKLVAIGGLARLFSDVWGSRYLAGHRIFQKLVTIGERTRIIPRATGSPERQYIAGHWLSQIARSLLWETTTTTSARVGRYRGD